jgi:hypothetical protein
MINLLFLAQSTAGSDAAGGGALAVLFLIVFGLGFLVWLLPGFIATARKHHNATPIWLVTIFCGWTFIGWMIAFIWAFTNPPPPQQLTINNN